MSKADYLKRLRLRFPEEPDTVLELGWHFHDMEKTKHYIRLLGTCNSNADIAWKAIREMYVASDIDGIKAKNKRFIKALLPFTCLDREGNPHSIAYHIRAMLDDPQVKAERQASQTKPKQVKESRDQQQPAQALPKRDNGIIIQIMRWPKRGKYRLSSKDRKKNIKYQAKSPRLHLFLLALSMPTSNKSPGF